MFSSSLQLKMENVTGTVNTNTSVGKNSTVDTTLSTGISTYIYETSKKSTVVTLSTGISTDIYGTPTSTVEKVTHITFPMTTIPGNSDDHGYTYNYYFGDEYIYSGYPFERPVYLYLWEILVIFVFLVNVVVIATLLRRKMRNATNMILAAIAISDSLTGLVTLPSYIMVYQNFDPVQEYQGFDINTNMSTEQNQIYSYQYDYYEMGFGNDTGVTPPYYDEPPPLDGYLLTKSLCRGFMISKYFLSRSFHTMSIFLTLFLAIQRYVSVAFPFKSQYIFSERKTIIWCTIIVLISPIFHAYHIGREKAANGVCQWELAEKGCQGGCIYLWFAFFIRHLIPCVVLLTITGLFIRQLRLGERNLRRMDSNVSQISRRVKENRRISIVVTAIVIVFLVPEIPYCIFLLYNAVEKTANNGQNIKEGTNRAIQMTYELLLVCSFHANCYIYTFLNRKFRKSLYRTFIKPVQRYVGDPRRLSISRTSSTSHRTTTRKTNYLSSKGDQELHFIHRDSQDKSGTLETKFRESFSVDITQRSHPDSHEIEALNAEV